MKGRQGEARSSFDLPFEGKEEKVVIDSTLYSSFSLSLLFFLIREQELKSHIVLSHGIRHTDIGRQANGSAHKHSYTLTNTRTNTQASMYAHTYTHIHTHKYTTILSLISLCRVTSCKMCYNLKGKY